MKVMCIHGHEGILEEGEVYTVVEQTKKGNYLLYEVNPPQPYACFKADRFVPIADLEDLEEIEELEADEAA